MSPLGDSFLLSGQHETHFFFFFFQALWNSGLFRELLHRMKALHQLYLPPAFCLVALSPIGGGHPGIPGWLCKG